jgi:cytochrome c oxidase subunit IV
MTSTAREIAHDQHTHPSNRFYIIIGVYLFLLTVLEVAVYVAEDIYHVLAAGPAALVIAILSAAKFVLVVLFYMHLKYDSKVYSGVFVFPAVLGTLVIGSLWLLYHIVHPLIR